LPTIRAAKEDVTRELYITLAAERVGVPREVVATEAARTSPRASPPVGRPGQTDVRLPDSPAPTLRPKGRLGARAERQLLRAMVGSADWRELGRVELKPELFEDAAFRELYVALLRLPASDTGSQLPEGLSGDTAGVWSELRASAIESTPEQLADDYASGQEMLAARPEYRVILRLTDPTEKLRRLAELDARYPAFARKRGYVRSGQKARQRQRRP